jgi:hypothetical protein
MVQTKKIQKSAFTKTWNAPDGNTIYYHEVFFNGDEQPYVYGSKSKDPDFLQAGEELSFMIKDVLKRTITRVQTQEQSQTKTTTSTYDGGVGAMVGNAITNAVNLVAAGKANVEDIEDIAEQICLISNSLKLKFSNK